MPRFHFHVKDGTNVRDVGGSCFPDLKAAKCEAVKFAGALIHEASSDFWDMAEWRMTVTDDHGLTLFCLVFTGTESATGIHAKAA